MIHWELCKRLKFDHADVENETHKIFRDFEIQTDNPYFGQKTINKKKRTSRFCCSSGLQSESKKSKNIDKYLDLARELKRLWNMKMMVITIVVGALAMVTKGLEKRLR